MRLLCAALILLCVPGCMRDSELALRDRLDRWFWLGETVAFRSRQDCAAGAIRLVQWQVKSPLYVASSVPEMLRALARHETVALKDPSLAPDAALVSVINEDRPTGMAMRRAALEGRICMDPGTESAFRYALDNPEAILVYDGPTKMVILLDPRTGLLILARGADVWDW